MKDVFTFNILEPWIVLKKTNGGPTPEGVI